MQYSKVVMVLNVSDYGLLGGALKKLNIPGVSISKVQGFGDYVNEYNEHGLSDSLKLEIYTGSEQAEEISLVLSNDSAGADATAST